ncbi:MAG: hypothetical protein J3K34DRAFT_415955 [Monoraphidium minutum]|nr:MAG: hypothetical protein J3K34DRAFT_415955 [Monoraphidium minutum]
MVRALPAVRCDARPSRPREHAALSARRPMRAQRAHPAAAPRPAARRPRTPLLRTCMSDPLRNAWCESWAWHLRRAQLGAAHAAPARGGAPGAAPWPVAWNPPPGSLAGRAGAPPTPPTRTRVERPMLGPQGRRHGRPPSEGPGRFRPSQGVRLPLVCCTCARSRLSSSCSPSPLLAAPAVLLARSDPWRPPLARAPPPRRAPAPALQEARRGGARRRWARRRAPRGGRRRAGDPQR